MGKQDEILIYDLLSTGKENAKTAKDLGDFLGTDTRFISRRIEQERLAGYAIAAVSEGEYQGYYKPADKAEMLEYCGRLRHRLNAIRAILKACEAAAAEMSFTEI